MYCLMPVFLLLTPPTDGEKITFNKHIAPILFKNCATCHRPGEVGPFSLLTYKDSAKRADHLAQIVADRQMPPWKPEPGYGEFLDERKLSNQDIELIKRWAAEGAPEGDPKDRPAAPTFSDGWQLGEPDLVLKMPEPFTIPATGRDVYQCFVLPGGITEDRTVAAVEFRPGNRRVVHHALYFLDNTGQARKLDEKDPGPGYRSFGGIGFLPTGGLGGWAPGATPRRLPEGHGRMMRKNSDVVFQMHYHPTGKEEQDQSMIGIYFTKKPAEHLVVALPVLNRRLDIPAGAQRQRVTASFVVPADIEAIGVTPHMHLVGREMKVAAVFPDGKSQVLIWIKDWDFNWQDQYLFKQRINMPKGTKIEVEAFYDNSDSNPKNPNSPPKRVRWGEQTTDEMCIAFLQIVPANRKDVALILQEVGKQQITQALNSFGREKDKDKK